MFAIFQHRILIVIVSETSLKMRCTLFVPCLFECRRPRDLCLLQFPGSAVFFFHLRIVWSKNVPLCGTLDAIATTTMMLAWLCLKNTTACKLIGWKAWDIHFPSRSYALPFSNRSGCKMIASNAFIISY